MGNLDSPQQELQVGSGYFLVGGIQVGRVRRDASEPEPLPFGALPHLSQAGGGDIRPDRAAVFIVDDRLDPFHAKPAEEVDGLRDRILRCPHRVSCDLHLGLPVGSRMVSAHSAPSTGFTETPSAIGHSA
jgi:hypothetical protein